MHKTKDNRGNVKNVGRLTSSWTERYLLFFDVNIDESIGDSVASSRMIVHTAAIQ